MFSAIRKLIIAANSDLLQFMDSFYLKEIKEKIGYMIIVKRKVEHDNL